MPLVGPATAQVPFDVEATAELTRDASFAPGTPTTTYSFPIYRASWVRFEFRYKSWASAQVTAPEGPRPCASLVTKGAPPAPGDTAFCAGVTYRTLQNDGTCTVEIPSTGESHNCKDPAEQISSVPGIYVSIELPISLEGSWQVTLSNAVSQPEPARIRLVLESAVKLGAFVLPDLVAPGTPEVPIFATLMEGGKPMGVGPSGFASYLARAKIFRVDPPDELSLATTLVDAHATLNPESGDGVFSGLLPTAGLARGDYIAALSFSGALASGGVIVREADVMFRITDEATVSLPGGGGGGGGCTPSGAGAKLNPSEMDPDPPSSDESQADMIEGTWYWRTGLDGTEKRWQFEENDRNANDAKHHLSVLFASQNITKTVTRYRLCAELTVDRNDIPPPDARCGAEVHFLRFPGIPNVVKEAASPVAQTSPTKVCTDWANGPTTLKAITAGTEQIEVQPDEASSLSPGNCFGNFTGDDTDTPDFEFEVTRAYLEYDFTRVCN
jgi:hypothetical protein